MSNIPEQDEDAEDALESIRHYFTDSEWKECSSYDKKSYWSAARNYHAMLKAGINARKPSFMLTEQEIISVQQGSKTPVAKLKKKQEENTPSGPARTSRRIRKKYHLEDDDQDVDEDILFCDECQQNWMGDCPFHGVLQEVRDAKVGAGAGRARRASATLPPRLLIKTGDGDGPRGVWAREFLPRRLRFGPYEGDVVHSDTEESGNWMRFVRFTTRQTAASANLRPFEYCGRLYYRTVRDVPAGTELLVRFVEEAKDPGAEWSRLSCVHCCKHFDVPVLLAQHQRAAPYCAAEERRQRRARVSLLAAKLPGNVMEAERQRKLLRRESLRQEKALQQQRLAARRRQLPEKAVEAEGAARQQQREAQERKEESARWRRHEKDRKAKLKELELLQRQQVDRIVAIEVAIAEVGAEASSAQGHACEVCGKTFRRGSLLRAHLATHSEDHVSSLASLGCPECIVDRRHRRKHPKVGNYWPTYACTCCTAKFATSRDLRDHVKLIHVLLRGKPRPASPGQDGDGAESWSKRLRHRQRVVKSR